MRHLLTIILCVFLLGCGNIQNYPEYFKPDEKLELAENIFKRNSKTAKDTLEIMGFSVVENGIKLEKNVEW